MHAACLTFRQVARYQPPISLLTRISRIKLICPTYTFRSKPVNCPLRVRSIDRFDSCTMFCCCRLSAALMKKAWKSFLSQNLKTRLEKQKRSNLYFLRHATRLPHLILRRIQYPLVVRISSDRTRASFYGYQLLLLLTSPTSSEEEAERYQQLDNHLVAASDVVVVESLLDAFVLLR